MIVRIKIALSRVWDIFFTLLFILMVVPFLWILTRLGIQRLLSEPRVVFGDTPMINSKYHSLALKRLRIDSITVVRGWYGDIHQRKDFDVVFGTVEASSTFLHRLYVFLFEEYFIFARLLWERNVFVYYFDCFYLRKGGVLRWLEVPVLKLLGKKVIALPYGSDVTTLSGLHNVMRKYVMLQQYPGTTHSERCINHQIRHFTRWADAIIGCTVLGPDHLPRIDFLCSSPLCIDEKEWISNSGPVRTVGEPMRVLHAPNHRLIKGTKFLLQAIDQLKNEGLNIELVMLERVQNEEVRRQMCQCHVVAEQFIMGWHGLNAIEGMASGKPVLSFLRDDLRQLYTLFSFAGDCPIVNTPINKIEENLKNLYYHPELCEELGRFGRAYVEKYHSLEAMGGFLKGVIWQVLYGDQFDAESYWEKRKTVWLDDSSLHSVSEY